MAIERIVNPTQYDDTDDNAQEEQRIENVLRPKNFKDYVCSIL